MAPECKIPGGFYLKARCIQNSEVAHFPPHVREIWDWLIKEANYQECQTEGKTIKRGQCLTSYKEIRDALSWRIGYRTERYSKNDCETAMKMLTKHTMVHTTKTTRGMIVTILNYDRYQNPENYESYNENHKKHTMNIQSTDTIRKYKKEREERNKETTNVVSARSHNGNGSDLSPCLVEIPLSGKNEPHKVMQDDVDRWQEIFPAVNVLACLKRIAQWNLDNPTRRKTHRGIAKHITSWLEREQNKGGGTFKREPELETEYDRISRELREQHGSH